MSSLEATLTKKGALTLLAIIGVGVSAWWVTRHLLQDLPTAWIHREFSLSPQQVCRVDQLHREYDTRCGPFCEEMCKANARLEELALNSSSLTPDLQQALVETDRIRTSARIALLEHFYRVAAELPPERRREYLVKVLPLVLDSCGSR